MCHSGLRITSNREIFISPGHRGPPKKTTTIVRNVKLWKSLSANTLLVLKPRMRQRSVQTAENTAAIGAPSI